MNWNQLQFFDKNGKNLNLSYDETNDKWVGDVFMQRVSVDLFEVAQVFIIQEFVNSNTNAKEFGYPHSILPSSTTTPCMWNMSWKNTDPTEIFLFQFNLDFQTGTQSALERELDGPNLEVYDEIDYVLDYDPSQTIDTSGFINTSLINSAALEINVAINSAEENTYKRTLIITDECTNHIVAEITFYGETVEEDERLRVMTQNFGYNVISTDSIIFRDTDINEILPDYLEVNRKRKEIMLEGHNIYPFIGSYKGLVNAIKFFGYNTLQIKEFWKNVDPNSAGFGKYVQTNPISAFSPTVEYNDNSITLPNKKFRKTSLFSLIYRINKITDEVTDEDLPITEEVNDFTIEEVIIKLFGLKRKLEKDFLPLNARIRDIVGEADFFALNELTNTLSRSDVLNIKTGIDADFSVSPDYTYIQDLRIIEDITGVPQNLVMGPYNSTDDIPNPPIGPDKFGPLGPPSDGKNYTVQELSDLYLAYFTTFAPGINTVEHIPEESSRRLPDKPNIPVGAPVVLENTSFGNLTWDDVNSNWKDLDNGVYYRFDFEPVNVVSGSTFTLKDPISNTSVSYTAIPGDTSLDVRDEIYNKLKTLQSSFTDPWVFYDITRSTTASGPTITIFGDSVLFLEASATGSSEFRKERLPGGLLYTWGSILRGNFQEIEWTIFKDEDDVSPDFFYTIRGPLQDLEKLPIILPYVGQYTIEIKLFDLYNNISSKVKNDILTVDSVEVEFSGWYQSREEKYIWNDSNYTWGEYGSYWDLPIPPTMTWGDESVSLYHGLDTINAFINTFKKSDNPNFHIMNFQNSGDISFRGPYYWDNIDNGSWEDLNHIWWDGTCVSGDTPAFFKFSQIQLNSFLKIIDLNDNEGLFYFPSTITNLSDAASLLNASTDPIISKYIYNLVLDSTENEVLIQAVAKYEGKYGDFKFVDMVDSDENRICNNSTGTDFTGCESLITSQGLSVTCNPTWNTVKFINDGKILPKYTWLLFTYDKCKIAGKDKPKWIVQNTSINNSPDIYIESEYLTYLFKDEGEYTITLELEDSNGNKYSKTRNIVKIK